MRLEIQLWPNDIFTYLRLIPVMLLGLNVLYKYGSMIQIASVNLLCILCVFQECWGHCRKYCEEEDIDVGEIFILMYSV